MEGDDEEVAGKWVWDWSSRPEVVPPRWAVVLYSSIVFLTYESSSFDKVVKFLTANMHKSCRLQRIPGQIRVV